MKVGNAVSAVSAAIAISACLIFANQSAAGAQDNATLDDLFKFFLEETTKAAPAHWSSFRSDDAFRESLAKIEPRFGHLAEYWELRAQTDPWRRYVNEYEYVDAKLNLDLLEKAISINLMDTPAISLLGRESEFANTVESEIRRKYGEDLQQFDDENCYVEINALKSATSADPGNAYYPFLAATKLVHLGELDAAILLFERAGTCSGSRIPYLFPASYIEDHRAELSSGTGVFSDTSVDERVQALISGLIYQPLPNYIRMKDAVKEIQLAVRMGYDHPRLFTAMHRGLCNMGKCSNGGLITALVSYVMMNVLRGEAYDIARETKDIRAELALVELGGDLQCIKTACKTQSGAMVDFHKGFETLALAIDADLLNEGKLSFSPNPAEMPSGTDPEGMSISPEQEWSPNTLRLVMLAGTPIITENQFAEREIWPIFDRIASFDYADPGAWYDERVAEREAEQESDGG